MKGGPIREGVNAIFVSPAQGLVRFEEMPADFARGYLESLLGQSASSWDYKIPELWRFWSHEDRHLRLLSFHAERILRGRRTGAPLDELERLPSVSASIALSQELRLLLDQLSATLPPKSEQDRLPLLIQRSRSEIDAIAIEAMSEIASLGFEGFPALRYVLRSLRSENQRRIEACVECCLAVTSEVDLTWLSWTVLQFDDFRARGSSRREATRVAELLRAQLCEALQSQGKGPQPDLGNEILQTLRHPSARVRRALRRSLRSLAEGVDFDRPALETAIDLAKLTEAQLFKSPGYSTLPLEVRLARIGGLRAWTALLMGLLPRSTLHGSEAAPQQNPLTQELGPEGREDIGGRLAALRDPIPETQWAAAKALMAYRESLSWVELCAIRIVLEGPSRSLDETSSKLRPGPDEPPSGPEPVSDRLAPVIWERTLEALRIEEEALVERLRALRDPDINVQIMALEEMLASGHSIGLDEFAALRWSLRSPEAVKWRVIEVLGNAGRLLPGLRECLLLQAASDDPRTAARAQAALERLPNP